VDVASILHPYTQRIPESMREGFINELINYFVEINPPDNKGDFHVLMMRLEIETYSEK
jgi:trans-aconitate 2-methyltransferase